MIFHNILEPADDPVTSRKPEHHGLNSVYKFQVNSVKVYNFQVNREENEKVKDKCPSAPTPGMVWLSEISIRHPGLRKDNLISQPMPETQTRFFTYAYF